MEKVAASKFFYIILLIFIALFFWICWTYISSIVLALLIASALYPLYSKVKSLFKLKEASASLIMTIFIILVLIIPVGGFVGTLSKEAFEFYGRTRDSVSMQKIQQVLQGDSLWAKRIRRAGEFANIRLTAESIQQLAAAIGKNVGLFLSRQLSSFASNLLNFLIHFFLMMLIIYYIFKDGTRLKSYILELLPFPEGQQKLVADKFREMGRAVILGNVLSSIIEGVMGGLGFFMFGLDSSFLWGTMIAVMGLLPMIGPGVVFIPATVILFIQGKIGLGIGFLIYNIVYTSIVEYIIKPRYIGKGMRMHSVLVFLGILGGLKLFGVLGVIYGPLIITILFTLLEIYRFEYKEKGIIIKNNGNGQIT
jgi:predicted PurR-regulated permease PerM